MYILPISLLTFITPQNADIAMASKEEPLLHRLDRLDIMIGYLEEMKGCNKSSSPSTPSSGTNATYGGNSSFNSSPKSLVKPIHTVIVETQVKGNLVDRLLQLEERVSQLVEQLEHEIESERNKEEEKRRSSEKKMKNTKKGFKGLVKSYMPRSQKPKV